MAWQDGHGHGLPGHAGHGNGFTHKLREGFRIRSSLTGRTGDEEPSELFLACQEKRPRSELPEAAFTMSALLAASTFAASGYLQLLDLEGRVSCFSGPHTDLTGTYACTVADPGLPQCPLVYVSPEFEKFTGHSSSFCLGRNCRFLQPENQKENKLANWEEMQQLQNFCDAAVRLARSQDVECAPTPTWSIVLNEKRDGTRFWMLFRLELVHLADRPYILGLQWPLTIRIPSLPALAAMRKRLKSHLEAGTSPLQDWVGDHYCPQTGGRAAGKAALGFLNASLPLMLAACMGGPCEALCKGRAPAASESSLPYMVLDLDAPDHPVVFFSDGLALLSGYEEAYVLGRNFELLLPRHLAECNTVNGQELKSLCKSFSEDDKVRAMTSLMLFEDSHGKRFWALLALQITIFRSNRFALVQLLPLPLPEALMVEAMLLSDGQAALWQLQAELREHSGSTPAKDVLPGLRQDLSAWVSKWTSPRPPSSRGQTLPHLGIQLDWGKDFAAQRMLSCIRQGVRHFCLKLGVSEMQTRDEVSRISELATIQKLRANTLQAEPLVLSVLIPVANLQAALRTAAALQAVGPVRLLLLEADKSHSKELEEAWQHLSHRSGPSLGLWGVELENLDRPAFRENPPAVVAIKVSPYNAAHAYRAIRRLHELNIQPLAFGSFGHNEMVLKHPCVKQLCEERGTEPVQLVAAWLSQKALPAVAAHWTEEQRPWAAVDSFSALCACAAQPRAHAFKQASFTRCDLEVLQELPHMNMTRLRLMGKRERIIKEAKEAARAERKVRALWGTLHSSADSRKEDVSEMANPTLLSARPSGLVQGRTKLLPIPVQQPRAFSR